MGASEDLFQLIKSLTKNEKRHFKLLSSLEKGDKFYLALFDLIDSQKKYDEKEIISGLRSSSHIRQFPVIKNYLYHSILKCLNYYSKEGSSGKEIREQLSSAEILFRKGLYAQCKKILSMAKQSALLLNKHPLLIEVLNWETKLLLVENKEHLLEEKAKHIASALKDIENINRYRTHALKLHTLFNKIGKPRNNKDAEKYKTIYQSSLFQNESKATTIQSKWLYYNLKTNYARAMDDNTERYEYAKRSVAHVEKFPEMIFEDPDMYIASMQNFIVVLLDQRKTHECLDTLKRFREYMSEKKLSKNGSALVRIFTISYIAELDLLFKSGEFEKGITLVNEVESGIEKFKNGLSTYNEIILYCCISRLFFGAGQYRKAVLWLNKAMSNPLETRQDLTSFMKIFNLLIHFELGNADILPNIIRSTYRYFYKSERLFKFEKIVLEFLRNLQPDDTRQRLISLWKDVKEKFTELNNDPLEKNAFDYFDYTAWLESKIEDRPFGEILRERR